MNSIFNYQSIMKVSDLSSLNLDHVLNESFSTFQIMTDAKQIVNKGIKFMKTKLWWKKINAL